MKIIADENILLLERCFADFADVVVFSGRDITSNKVSDADVLLVRSVTQVNEALLAKSNVKFVGSATIGTDHIDQSYLQKNGIKFAYAPGCNAIAVAEYVLAAIFYWSKKQKINLSGIRVGIIGAGNTGSNLAKLLAQLGIDYILHDPPLEVRGDGRKFVGIDEIRQCDVVSVHVPLTMTGLNRTWHLIDFEFMQAMRENSLLINSSRGAVLDNVAALKLLSTSAHFKLVLDVWEQEPNINTKLLDLVLLGTPHIAGYSVEGKIRGTFMLYQQLCQFFKIPQTIQIEELLPIVSKMPSIGSIATVADSINGFYDIKADCLFLGDQHANIAETFEKARKNYKNRYEFS